jgi:hypothetical protein
MSVRAGLPRQASEPATSTAPVSRTKTRMARGTAPRLHRAVITCRQDAWDRSRSPPDHCHGQRLRRPGGQQPIIQSQHSRCLHAFAPYRAERRTGADHQRSAGTSGRLCRPGATRCWASRAWGTADSVGGLQRPWLPGASRWVCRPRTPSASMPATPRPSRRCRWACTTTASTSSHGHGQQHRRPAGDEPRVHRRRPAAPGRHEGPGRARRCARRRPRMACR